MEGRMTKTRVRWDRVGALWAVLLMGVFVGRSNGLPWYATVVLAGMCVAGAWSVMWR